MNTYTDNTNSKQLSLGIRGRLLTGFSIVCISIFVAIGATLIFINDVEKGASHTINTEMPLYDSLLNLGGRIYQSQANLAGYTITGSKEMDDNYQASLKNINIDIGLIDKHIKNSLNASAEAKWTMIKSTINELSVIQSKIYTTSSQNLATGTKPLFQEADKVLDKLLGLLEGNANAYGQRQDGFYDEELKTVNSGSTDILTNIKQIEVINFALLFGIVFISVLVSLMTAKRIITPLNNAIDIAKRIAAGERNINVTVSTHDETGTLLSALSDMQQSIQRNEELIKQSEVKSRELYENILRTATQFSKHSSQVASGDLRERIEIIDKDIMSQLGLDLNTMTESLSGITKQIIQASINMVRSLDEVKQAVDTQSSGATEQASSINQITASLEEIEKSSTQTMEKAKALGVSAERTREKGQQGLDAVEQSITGMKVVREKVQLIAQTILELSQQTQQVGEITAVVNSLAQQSKMLALNASIEAAKAGEAGKGFAVVAAEVKNLAEQSEQSTAQVQKILEDIKHATEKAVMVTEEGVKGVDHGTDLVEQTGDVVRKLTEVIQETSLSTQQIEAAVRQEGVGIEQIASGMNEINQVTASFVASSKQTTDAIGSLSGIARNIKESVETYKI